MQWMSLLIKDSIEALWRLPAQQALWLVAPLAVLWRSCPFNFHFRILWNVVCNKFSGQKKLDFFDGHCVLNQRCWPDEIDFNLFMKTLSYTETAETGRSVLICCSNLLSFLKRHNYTVATGGIYHQFIYPIRPLQRYKCNSWLGLFDDKWFYVFSRFLSDDEHICYANGFSKMVIKAGR